MTHEEYYRMFAFLNDSNRQTSRPTPPRNKQTGRIFPDDQLVRPETHISRLASEWPPEETLCDDVTLWKTVRPPEENPQAVKQHYVLDDIVASRLHRRSDFTDFTMEQIFSTDTAVRLKLMEQRKLATQGPGRSIKGMFARQIPAASRWIGPTISTGKIIQASGT